MPFYATVGQISLLDELHESYSDARLMPFGAEGAGNTRIPLSPGIATLRVPFPFPLDAGALANDLKLTALRKSLSLRDLGLRPTSLPRLRRGGAKENRNAEGTGFLQGV